MHFIDICVGMVLVTISVQLFIMNFIILAHLTFRYLHFMCLTVCLRTTKSSKLEDSCNIFKDCTGYDCSNLCY
jgi:hypothetical protein